ncbi:MAG: hypothetical protein ACREQN_04040, partial [Candidatus Binataceae bacterium]
FRSAPPGVLATPSAPLVQLRSRNDFAQDGKKLASSERREESRNFLSSPRFPGFKTVWIKR